MVFYNAIVSLFVGGRNTIDLYIDIISSKLDKLINSNSFV